VEFIKAGAKIELMMDEARVWFSKAERDLDSARYNMKGGKHEVAAFLSQQAAEKALKALYTEIQGSVEDTRPCKTW